MVCLTGVNGGTARGAMACSVTHPAGTKVARNTGMPHRPPGWKIGPARTSGDPGRGRRPPSRGTRSLRLLRFQDSAHLVPEAVASGFIRILRPALVVDRTRRACWIGGREHSMMAQDVLLALLACLVRHQGSALSVGELHFQVWGRPMTNSSRQSGKIHYHMHRIRNLLREAPGGGIPLRTATQGYFIDTRVHCVLVEPRREVRTLQDRSHILSVMKDSGFLDTRTYCRLTGSPATTARVHLRGLVARGIIRNCGRGRAAHYHLADARCARNLAT